VNLSVREAKGTPQLSDTFKLLPFPFKTKQQKVHKNKQTTPKLAKSPVSIDVLPLATELYSIGCHLKQLLMFFKIVQDC
jgi:hypothetical protein